MDGRRIAFIGGGNMGEAMIRGLLKAQVFPPEAIVATDIREERLEYLRQTFGVRTTADNCEAARSADVVVLAVKPQVMGPVLDGLLGAISEGHLVISIAAGIPTSFLQDRFAFKVRTVRVMPNTPALVLEGASALAPGDFATRDDLNVAVRIFESVGKVVVVEEEHLDAVTGLSGSGPAYVFLIIEALSDAGVKVGLSRDVAQLLAIQTVYGAARLALETKEHPGKLKDMVTSPGGTAIAGLHTLEQGGLRTTLINAVEVATNRSRELGRRKDR
jgi:pyrroline-5-carboxylate reductase